MSTEEIYEGNKLIEIFNGNDIDSDTVVFPSGKRAHISESQWHERWDYLMPVVQKIESLSTKNHRGFTVSIQRKHVTIYCHYDNRQDGAVYLTPWRFDPESKAHAAWLAVVDFIKWYKQQPV